MYFMSSHRLKGKWSLRRRQGFHSTPSYYLSFAVTPHRSPLWYNPSLIYYLPKGEKVWLRALMTLFLAIHAKGGESISPKQKDRTTTPILKSFKYCFQLVLYLWYFKNWYLLKFFFLQEILSQLVSKIFDLLSIWKTLLNTKRRISLWGSFVERKAFETGGENFKS